MDAVPIAMHPRLLAAHLFPAAHAILRRAFPRALWQGCVGWNEVALTFDDGPHPADTPQLLDVLDRHQVVATFFLLGEQIERLRLRPLVRDVAANGHQVAIHGYLHRAFPLQSPMLLAQQLNATRALLAEASQTDSTTIRDVRPPFGLFTLATLNHLTRWHYRPVMWSIVPLHWLQPANRTVEQVARQVRDGSLIVLHEGQPDGPPVAQLADEVIQRVRGRGFRFVTVEQMWRRYAARVGPQAATGKQQR